MKKMHFSTRTTLNIFFAIILSTLLICTYYSYKQIDDVKKSTEWIKHTNQVLEATNNLLIILMDAESNTRGYIITGDSNFIINMDDKIKNVFSMYDTIKVLTKDNTEQQHLIVKLKPLLDARTNALKKSIQLKSSNQLKDIIAGITHQGQILTMSILTIIDDLHDNESALLQQRENEFLKDFNSANIINNMITLITIGLLILIILFYNKLLTDLMQSQEQAKKLESLLKGIIGGSNEFIAALDLDFNFLIFNEAFETEFRNVFGKKPIIGKNLKDSLSHMPEQQKKAIELWGRALKGEEFTIIEEFGINSNKYEITFSAIYNDNNQLIGASHIVREVGRRLQEEKELKAFTEKLEISFKEAERQSKEMAIVNDMNNKVRTSETLNETLSMTALYLKKIYSLSAGVVYLMDHSGVYLEAKTAWNNPEYVDQFLPEECWSLRQGNVYLYINENEGLPCHHCKQEKKAVSPYLCIPLMALNELIGVLYFIIPKNINTKTEIDNFYQMNHIMLQNLSVQIALSISNIRMHEALKMRSTRDVLTNLQNRSYLDESFDKDLQRAKRNHSSIAIIMMDLDFFKNVNDTYGHEAGDEVLRTIGKLLTNEIRKSDMACRYGGEEILMILYDTTLQYALEKAEQLKEKIAQLEFHFTETVKITASFGLSIFPNDGETKEQLIKAADEALYQSKKLGRNRVTVYNKNIS